MCITFFCCFFFLLVAILPRVFEQNKKKIKSHLVGFFFFSLSYDNVTLCLRVGWLLSISAHIDCNIKRLIVKCIFAQCAKLPTNEEKISWTIGYINVHVTRMKTNFNHLPTHSKINNNNKKQIIFV